MQDRFVGDIGDFGKYGLLRALMGIQPGADPQLSLGVVWYLNSRKNTDYLSKGASFENCDPELFASLTKIISREQGRGTLLNMIDKSRIPGIRLHSTKNRFRTRIIANNGYEVHLTVPQERVWSSSILITEFLCPRNGLSST